MKAIYTQPLQSGYTYHILNQGNNGEDIFKEERNYDYFLKKYKEFISPIADTYAWCLMPNHFHVQVQFKNYEALHSALPRRFFSPPEGIKCSDEVTTIAESELFEVLGMAGLQNLTLKIL